MDLNLDNKKFSKLYGYEIVMISLYQLGGAKRKIHTEEIAYRAYKIKIEDFIRRTKEKEDWQKVGGDFMLVIDSFSCFDKCHYYEKAWIAWLEKKINVNEFQEIIDILQKVFIGDLNSLINNEDFNFLDIYS